LITYQKDGLWVNYGLADGSQSPFAASLIGNLRHWLEDNPDMKKLLERLSGIHRENICGK
jgi:ArsR family transcriptional regulator